MENGITQSIHPHLQTCNTYFLTGPKLVAKYVESTRGRLELHFLPPYAPDLNPDEFAWSHLKQNGTSKKPLHKNEALRKRVQQDLAKIKEDRSLVRSFFLAPSVSYATY